MKNKINKDKMKNFLLISFLATFLLSSGLVFATHEFGQELITNNDFSQVDELPINVKNVTGFVGTPPIGLNRPFDYFNTTPLGSRGISIMGANGDYWAYEIPIQDPNTSRVLYLDMQNATDLGVPQWSLAQGFANYTIQGGLGNSYDININDPNCDGTDPAGIGLLSCENLGNSFYRIALNITESINGFDEHTVDRVFLSYFGTAFPPFPIIDNVNLTEDGITTFFDDFETGINLPKDWVICDVDLGEFYCTRDAFFTTNNVTNGMLNVNDGISNFVSKNFTLEQDKEYRLIFTWNGTGLDGNLDSQINLLTDAGQQLDVVFNNTTGSVSANPQFNVLTETTQSSGGLNTYTLTFEYTDPDATYRFNIAENFLPTYFSIDPSLVEIIPDVTLVSGLTLTILEIVGIVVVIGFWVYFAYTEIKSAKTRAMVIVELFVLFILGLLLIIIIGTFQ